MLFSRKKSLAALTLSVAFFSLPASAQNADRVDIKTTATFQYISEDDMDLGTGSADREDSLSEQLQVRVGADLTEEYFAFFNGRALNIDGDVGSEDETGNVISQEQAFLELRELYLLKKNLFGVDPLSLQVGRQRVKEPRALWWNSDNDLVRVNYNSTLLSGFVAAGEDISSYRTTTDNDFREDDEDRFRVLGETSWQYQYNHFLEGRVLYEDDHSGIESVGSVVNGNDRDNEDQELVWAGLRAAGTAGEGPIGSIKYRADLIGLVGEEEQLATVAGPGADRTVTGSAKRDVAAWAFDVGAIIDPRVKSGAVLTAGYAFGSGDDDPTSGTSHEFRQTDIQGSSSRIGLERQQQKNYGEVLRPELSNIHVLTAGVGVPLSAATDASLTYFYYHLDEDATALRSSGIGAALNGSDKSLGHGLDFIVNVDVDDQFQLKTPRVDGINFRFVLGGFHPGDAYEPTGDNNAVRVFSELQFRF